MRFGGRYAVDRVGVGGKDEANALTANAIEFATVGRPFSRRDVCGECRVAGSMEQRKLDVMGRGDAKYRDWRFVRASA